MSEFDSIEEELKFMADCSDDRGDSETSLMFVRYLAHIRKLNAELAALKAGQGEAVEVVAWSACAGSKKTFDFKCDAVAAINYFKSAFPNGHTDIIELMTVAQHERLIAAITAPPATGVIVPRELLEAAIERIELHTHFPLSEPQTPRDAENRRVTEQLRALLAQSQGVKP